MCISQYQATDYVQNVVIINLPMPNPNALHCYCDLQNASVLLKQTQKARPHTLACTHTFMHLYVHICSHAHIHTCMCMCMYTHVCGCAGEGVEGCVQFAEVCEAGTMGYAKGKILVM